MPRYLDMLRAKGVFKGPNPLGMPNIDDGNVSDMFRSVLPHVTAMKEDDARRQREMMEFEASLARRNQPQQLNAPIPKKNVVYGGVHPPTTLQQQFRQDDVAARAQKDRLASLAATQTGALNNSSILNKQRSDAEMAQAMAEIQGRQEVATTNRASAEKVAAENKIATAKAADDARTDKERTDAKARLEKGQPMIMKDPKTGLDISVRFNPATNSYERTKIDDAQAGSAERMGIDKQAVATPDQESGISMAQQTLDEISNNLLDKDDKLTSKAQWATGGSSFLGKIPLPTEARSGAASIKRVAANQLLSLISHMKNTSKTGSTGMGNMSNQDRQALEAAASKLGDLSLPEEEIRKEIVRVRDILKATTARENKGNPNTQNPDDVNKRADDLIKKYGG